MCDKERSAYEISYNVRGGLLKGDDLIEVGADLHNYEDVLPVIDPMDRDSRLEDAYESIRP